MQKILISIKPEYVKQIINGTKKFEYRKFVAKEDVSAIIIYSTLPEKRVVAEAEIVEILSNSPENLWKQTNHLGGVSKVFFDQYFKDKNIAYAYKLGQIKIYETAKTLNDFGVKVAPQSYTYIKNDFLSK